MWRVELQGAKFDLARLAKAFDTGDPRVVRDGDRYLLEASEFAEAPDHGALLTRAVQLLTMLNGLAVLESETHRAVATTGKIIGPDKQVQVLLAGTAHIRTEVYPATITVDGQAQQQPAPPISRAARTSAAGNADAEAVIRLLGGPLDWVNLYRILDHLRHALGGISGIVEAGYATEADLKKFKHTANSYAAIGDSARHGADGSKPPADPMTFEEARTLIRSIVRRWLAS